MKSLALDSIRKLSWGTHLCQFYQTKEEFTEVLAFYFREGLTHNEFCLWITSEPLSIKEARLILRQVKLDDYLKKGQIKLLDFDQWYTRSGGGFDDPASLSQRLIEQEKQALAGGFAGLRVSANFSCPHQKDRQNGIEYEAGINNLISRHRIIAMCSYSLQKYGASEVLDIISCHQYALLVKQDGKWVSTERAGARSAREALQESEERYSSFVRNFQGIAYRGDMNFRPLFIHGAVETITGYTEDEFTSGKIRWDQVVHPDDLARFYQGSEKIRTIPRYAAEREYRIIRKNGQARWVLETCQNICDDSGTPVAVQGTFYDITDRKRTEQHLLLLSSLVKQSAEGMAVIDMDGNLLFVNDAFAAMHGYTPEELGGRHLSVFHTPEQLPSVEADLRQIKEEGVSNAKIWHVRKNGTVFPALMQNSLLRDEAGNPIGMIGTLKDITEQEQAENALRVKDSAIATSIIGVAFSDLEDKMTYMNSSCLKMWGYENGQEILGKPVIQFWYDKSAASEAIKTVNTKGGWTGELKARRKDGSPFDVLLSVHRVTDRDGKIICSMASIMDITERKQAEEELKKYRQHLEELVAERTHELTAANERLSLEIVERRRIEEELRKSRAQMAEAQRLAHVGSWERDLATGKVTWSDELCKIFGISAGESFSFEDGPMNLVPPDDQTSLRSLFENACRTLEPFDFEHRVIRPDGSLRVLQGRGEVLTDADGNPVRMVGFAQDITEVRQAADALRESEAKYRLIVENAQEGICTVDKEARITFVNPRMAEMIGYTVNELVGKRSCSLVGECDQKKAKYYFGLCKRGSRECIEFRFLRKDGSWLYTSLGVSPVIDDEGRFVGVLALVTDVTERKQAGEALRKQAQIIDQIHDSVVSTDMDGYVTSWNKGAERLHGYKEEEALGKHISFIYPEDEQDFFKHHVLTPLLEKGNHEVEVRHRSKTGKDIYVHLSLSVLRDNDGNAIGMIGYSMDITGRKLAEEEKGKIQAQFLQAQKMEAIGILAGGVAHDFNNLLTTIQGYTTMAMMGINESDPAFNDLNQVHTAASRAANLTRQLLLFSRKQPIKPTPFDLNGTVDDLLKMLHRLIGEDITIRTGLEPDLWAIRADEGNIEQVIMNLAVNARDAMPKGGTLTIRTENVILDEAQARLTPGAQPGHFVRMTIADTGCGMNKETADRIFEPFFTTKGAGKGSGLGLAVVYGIIKQHEGWITVHSEPGQGSTFAVYLPSFPVRLKTKARETVSLKDFQGNGERILLVEDEESVRSFIKRTLNENGYTAIQAADAEEALNIFEQEKGNFHLVISDVVLPGKTGLELIERLRAARSDIRILLISGYPDQKSQWATIQERGYPFIPKPLALIDLLRAAKELTGHT
ncbi:MAG: PAS domain S-box protein [bacterium]